MHVKTSRAPVQSLELVGTMRFRTEKRKFVHLLQIDRDYQSNAFTSGPLQSERTVPHRSAASVGASLREWRATAKHEALGALEDFMDVCAPDFEDSINM